MCHGGLSIQTRLEMMHVRCHLYDVQVRVRMHGTTMDRVPTFDTRETYNHMSSAYSRHCNYTICQS